MKDRMMSRSEKFLYSVDREIENLKLNRLDGIFDYISELELKLAYHKALFYKREDIESKINKIMDENNYNIFNPDFTKLSIYDGDLTNEEIKWCLI